MLLQVQDFEKEIKLNPNLGLVLPVENEGEEQMADNKGNVNLWDTIAVEMTAHFDAVKITLGDLKKIENGMVVDLTSIYDNKVTLTVEDKPIARGELVIVNDRYGVKVDEILANAPKKPAKQAAAGTEDADEEVPEMPAAQDGETEDVPVPAQGGGDGEDEFDYSDFELEDDI